MPRLVRVACAIVEKGGRILVAQRASAMSRGLRWEFPGGKIRRDETPETGVVREIGEELGIAVMPIRRLAPVRYRYPDLAIELVPVLCRFGAGRLRRAEHCAARWLSPAQALKLDWTKADIPVLRAYLECRTAKFNGRAIAKAACRKRTSRRIAGPRSRGSPSRTTGLKLRKRAP
jgi:8-oxo-dGTP diphosphatase